MNINTDNLLYFYLIMSVFAVIGLLLAYFGKTKEEDKKRTTTTTHKAGR